MELHLKLAGILLVGLGIIHAFFPKYFNWKQDFNGVQLINRQMMYVHAMFIGLVVMLIGLLCLSSAKEIIETKMGQRLALGLFIFWLLRLLTQLFGYSPKLWKGKRFETSMHILFTILWIYLSTLFLIVYWNNKSI